MSSYWSKRRKVVSNVQEHVNAISNAMSMAGDFELSPSPTMPEISPHVQDDICSFMSTVDNETIDDFSDNLSHEPEAVDTISFDQFVEGRSEHEMSDSEFEDSDTDDADVNLMALLVSWVTTFNVTHASLNALLFILRKYHTYLPKDARTLLKTAKNYNILNIAGGCYYHFGIEKWVKTMIFTENVKEVSIQVNIDGLPLFKSSGAQFWPILGKLVKPQNSKPFIIGLFSGVNKPSNLFEYLEHLVTELDYLFQNGILISEMAEERVVFSLSCVICDAPAKAYIKQIKGHSGYNGCDQCCQNGYWNSKMTFPETNASLRTDVSFAEKQDEEHHIGQTPFSNLPVGMVSQFPPDPMHLVYLGVVKRMIGLWMKGPVANASRIGSNAVKGISDHLVQLRGYLPREFNRKARTLYHVERWKATEFRQFLLYTGPVVLKKHLSPAKYRHFMLLFISIFCWSCDFFCETYREFVQELLCKFVEKFGELYGMDMLVFNVHGLVHLAKATEKFGNLDNFSAFVFESFLGNLKRLVRKPSLPLQQVIRRISETKGNFFDPTVQTVHDVKLKKIHVNGPVPRAFFPLVASQYKAIQFPNLYFSASKGDNCCLVNDDVVIIRNIITLNGQTETYFVFEKFSRSSDFFHLPLPSTDLRIKRVSHLSGTLHVAMYLVVEFQLTDEVAMVSEKWLSNDKTEVMWPNFKSSFKFEIALKQHKNPEANWTKWGVKRILYKTNVFEKALQKAKEAEDESDIQTDIEAVIPVQEKRKKRPNPRFVSSRDSDSASEEDVCPVPPPQIRLPTVSTPCSLFPSALASSSSHVPSALPTSSRIAPSALPSSLSHVPSALPTSSRIAPSALPTSSRIVQSALPTSSRCVPVFTTSSRSVPSATPTTSSRVQSRPPTQSSSSRGTNEISERDIRIMRGMEEIKAEQKEIKAMLATVLQRLDVTHRDCQVPEGIKLPLCTLEEMEENEGMLQDSTVFKMMVDHLSSIGGSSVKNMTKRVMKAVMKNSLAQDYNWTGARNKLSFDCLKLSSAIIRAVKRNFAGSDHSVTEFYVKDWLRNARDRDGGRMKRMKHSNNITAEDNDYN